MPIPGIVAVGHKPRIVTYIAKADAAATSVTLPVNIVAGDFLLAQAIRDGDETTPSLPAGWTNILAYDPLVNLQARYAYKVAASAETSGTWTNAHGVGIMAFRNVSGIGDWSARNNAEQPTTIPNLSLQVVNGSSVVVCFVASRGLGADYTTGVPAGLTNRFARIIPAGGCFGGHHSAAVSSFAQVTQSPGGTARNYGFAVELKLAV